MRPGDYRTILTRMAADAPTAEQRFGSQQKSWRAWGKLFAAVTEEVAQLQDAAGNLTNGAKVTIRIRNYPTLSVEDRLYDAGLDQTYEIETIVRGVNELVVVGRRGVLGR